MMRPDFDDRAEIVYREYFSKVEPLWEQTPDALKRLPRGEAMLAEMIGDAWLRRQYKAMEPLERILESLKAGLISAESETGRELAKIAEDPKQFSEALKWNRQQQGDLAYELGMGRLLAAIEYGEQDRALEILNQITGRNWGKAFSSKARKWGLRPDDVRGEVLSVVWELIADLVAKGAKGKRGLYSNQRAALSGAITKTIYDYLEGLKKGAPPVRHEAKPDPRNPEAFKIEEKPSSSEESTYRTGEDDRIAFATLLERADLTDREKEAIQLSLDGLEGAGLAAALGVTKSTAGVHIHNAKEKILKKA